MGLAREFVERASHRMPIVAAAVVGSVARGDFNVWSDIDVIVIVDAPAGTRARASGTDDRMRSPWRPSHRVHAGGVPDGHGEGEPPRA